MCHFVELTEQHYNHLHAAAASRSVETVGAARLGLYEKPVRQPRCNQYHQSKKHTDCARHDRSIARHLPREDENANGKSLSHYTVCILYNYLLLKNIYNNNKY